MANPIYESMKNAPQGQNTQADLMQMVQQPKSNPVQFLRDRGYNIPANIDLSNPNSIINSLMQSGQTNNSKYQQAIRMLGGIRHRR